MNYLLIGVIVVIAACALHGYMKGFIRMALSLVSLIATIALVTVVTPYISNFLINKTPAYENLKTNVTAAFLGGGGEEAENDAPSDEEEPGHGEAETTPLEGGGTFSPADALQSLGLPNGMRELLLSKNQEDQKDAGQSLLTEVFEEYVSSYIAKVIINAISFIFAFLVITVAIRMTIFSLNIISHIPIIKGINKTIGLIAGGAEGVLIVWVVFVGAMIFLNRETGQAFFRMVNESAFLTYLYQTDFLIDFVNGLV